MSSRQRIDIQQVDPNAYKAVLGMQRYVNSSGLKPDLTALVDIRASQLNHCAWCLDMHVEDARRAGVSQRQIDLVAAWEEAPSLFSSKEQAALAFTEQVTLIGQEGVTDDVWEQVNEEFTQEEIVALLMKICVINVWNRMNVTARTDLPEE